MKISRRELDSTVLEKLDQLDNVAETYDENNPDGFVSYGPNGFYFKKTNDTFLKKVYDENEIVELENSLSSRNRNITSSLLKDIRLDNKTNMAAMAFLYNLQFTDKKEFPSIFFYKFLNNKFLIIDKDGILYFNEKQFEIEKSLREQFNISKNFSLGDIVDICLIDEDNLLIATTNFGLYKLKLSSNELELLCVIEKVRKIEMSHTESLFVATDSFCAFYDLKSGNCIEKFYNIANSYQIPKDIIKADNGIFVIANPAGPSIMNNLIHFYKLDKAGIGYNIQDGLLPKHSFDISHQILFTKLIDDSLYLVGKVNNKYCFIWKYNIKTFELNEEYIDCREFISLNGFFEANGYYLILSSKDLFIIKDNKIYSHYKLPEKCFDLYLLNGELYSILNSNIAKFSLLSFEKKIDNLSYLVYNGQDACNNIDIFIKNATRNERISLIDMDTNKMITPSFYIVYGNNSIIKLMNCKSTKIKMLISVNENSFLEGIVVRNNRIFLR